MSSTLLVAGQWGLSYMWAKSALGDVYVIAVIGSTGEMNRVIWHMASLFQSVLLRGISLMLSIFFKIGTNTNDIFANDVGGKQAATNNLQKLVVLRHGNKSCRLIYVRIVDSRAIFYSVILPLLPGKKLLLKFTKHTPPVDRTHSTSTSNIRACTCSNDAFCLKE